MQRVAVVERHLPPQIDEGYAEDDLEANLQRDKHARLTITKKGSGDFHSANDM
jgi:hypothetical protein